MQKAKDRSPTLYSYCLRYDDGAAPNPYWGVCTLVICKPAIRRKARVGDWIVGLGSKEQDAAGKVVYAMKLTNSMSMRRYDAHCREYLPKKIPRWSSRDFRRKVGDCIYAFDVPRNPILRQPSVHNEGNRLVDLGGKNALLSEHFFYFGLDAVPLPTQLCPIIHQTQGHKSHANTQYVEPFVQWIETEFKANHLYSDPQLKAQFLNDPACGQSCGSYDLEEDHDDAVCFRMRNGGCTRVVAKD